MQIEFIKECNQLIDIIIIVLGLVHRHIVLYDAAHGLTDPACQTTSRGCRRPVSLTSGVIELRSAKVETLDWRCE
jgi:hypothetical protein